MLRRSDFFSSSLGIAPPSSAYSFSLSSNSAIPMATDSRFFMGLRCCVFISRRICSNWIDLPWSMYLTTDRQASMPCRSSDPRKIVWASALRQLLKNPHTWLLKLSISVGIIVLPGLLAISMRTE